MWFGDPFPSEGRRAPYCEDEREHIATPVGERCLLCDVAFVEGDRGTRFANAHPSYAHRECSVRSVLGNLRHVQGKCQHVGDCNEHSTLTFREEALEVAAWLESSHEMS